MSILIFIGGHGLKQGGFHPGGSVGVYGPRPPPLG